MKDKAASKFQDEASQQLGGSKFDTATGTIAGVMFAIITVTLAIGLDDLETQAPGYSFTLWVVVCGIAGYFFGAKYEERHHVKIDKLALRLERQEYINAKLAKSRGQKQSNDI